MSPFTESDEALAGRMGVLLHDPDHGEQFAIDLATRALERERVALGRARHWRRRCQLFAVLLAGAIVVIEAMAVGRI